MRLSSRRARVVVAACVVFLFTIALRATFASTGDAVLTLNTIPVVMIAFEFGWRGGAIAATIALAWVVAWHAIDLSALGYFSRGVTYFAAGLIVGTFADRLRAAQAAVVRSERRVAELALEHQEQFRTAALERERLARELHDVIAHSVSVMTVQSTAARRVLEDDPARAAVAMEAVERTGREAMGEMRRMVAVLRPAAQAELLTPQPGIEDLPALVDQMREAGLDVTMTTEGNPHHVPVAVGLSAYRIVQEALTNTLKHAGPVRAGVRVRYTPETVEIECRDDGGNGTPAAGQNGVTGPGQNGGHGLAGMRERASLLGGEVTAGPQPQGGFRVSARLPL
jgi:signal transduction histidine kinase